MPPITLNQIYQIAREVGLDDEGARVAVAIAQTEGGLNGAVGDNGQSFGPFQFYTGGQLGNFAASLGVPMYQAGEIAKTRPDAAAEWALQNYLGNAIRQGQSRGLSGSDLATYAQRYGQVSVSPERAGLNYQSLYGGSSYSRGAIPDTVSLSGSSGASSRQDNANIANGMVRGAMAANPLMIGAGQIAARDGTPMSAAATARLSGPSNMPPGNAAGGVPMSAMASARMANPLKSVGVTGADRVLMSAAAAARMGKAPRTQGG